MLIDAIDLEEEIPDENQDVIALPNVSSYNLSTL
jgi:hypothetical protein